MRHRNRGTGGNLGILAAFALSNWIGWILLVCFLVWLPWWVYAVVGTGIGTYFIVKVFEKESENDEL